MKSSLYHLQINIDFKNLDFYKKVLTFMGWSVIFEDKDVSGFTSGAGGDLWFIQAENNQLPNYDAIGVNHVALRVNSVADVDQVKDYLEKTGIKMLFGTPRHRPEFAESDTETYYQIMFESPDRILFEIVYIGPSDKL